MTVAAGITEQLQLQLQGLRFSWLVITMAIGQKTGSGEGFCHGD